MTNTPTYRVEIQEHVCSRWIIPSQQTTVVGTDEEDACLFAVRLAHSALSMPPWKPLRRISLEYASATRTDSPPEVVSDPQLVLFTDEQIAA